MNTYKITFLDTERSYYISGNTIGEALIDAGLSNCAVEYRWGEVQPEQWAAEITK